MSEQAYRERWVSEVFRTVLITDTVRVTLLALVPRMDEDGMVAVARDDLAEMLARSDKRVGERLRAAIEAGFIERVSRGQRNGKGRYQATLPGDPSSGRSTVPKKPGVSRTVDRPEEDSLQDGLRGEENSGLRDGGPSSRRPLDPKVFRTADRPEEAAPYIRNRARAVVTHHRPQETTPSSPTETGTGETTSPRADMRVSQSARKREAFRYLNERYGLTEFEAAAVVAEVRARAPKEIRSLVPYLAGMKEGDLADIVGAVQNRTAEMTAPAEPEGTEPDVEDEHPARPAMPDWCGHCDKRTRFIELLDGRPKRCPTCHPLRNQETA